jgi:predicted amidohydrolase YtcJ
VKLFITGSLLAAYAIAASFSLAQSSQPAYTTADTIYYHGHILTGVGLDTGKPQQVTALAISKGEIAATGDDATILAKYKSGATVMVDLHDSFVMPGFNDAHAHIGDAGQIKLSVDLTGVRSLKEMQARIQEAAARATPGAWLTGGGWDHTLWTSKVLPTKTDLDLVTGDHPAFFVRVDGHIAVANSAALKISGITKTTPAPQGGKIDIGVGGEPSGIVRETAQGLVDRHVMPPTASQRKHGIELALQDAVSHGVTSVQDNSDWDDFLIYEQLEREGKLPARISEWLPFDTSLILLKAHREYHPQTDRMLHTTMLKGFMDGSLGSRTAALNAPYSDDPGNSGIPRYEQGKLNQMATEREQAGFQMGFHAIGDRAVGMALDAFAAAEGPAQPALAPLPPPRRPNRPVQNEVRRAIVVPVRLSRNRIEHSQMVSAGDFVRYRQLGVIASMQPNHLLTDMSWAEARLGAERAKYSYAWKSFLDAGVPLAFGTDYPVEPITPFRGVYAAVTRMNEAGTMTYHPEEKLTMAQTLYAYTQGSAYGEFTEQWKGKLAPGYVADFVVLDRDLTAIVPAEILKTRVLRTVVAGKTVFTSTDR